MVFKNTKDFVKAIAEPIGDECTQEMITATTALTPIVTRWIGRGNRDALNDKNDGAHETADALS